MLSEIASNVFYLTTSQIITRLLGLVVTMVLARYLKPVRYGDLSLAYTYCGIFATFVEAGLDLTLIREASQDPSQLGRLVGNGILLRGVLALGGYALAFVMLPLLSYDPTRSHLLRLAIVLLLLSPFSLFRIVFLVTMNIKRVAVLDIVVQLINTALMLGMMLLGTDQEEHILLTKIGATGLGQFLYLIYSRHLLGSTISFRPDWSLWISLLKKTTPLAVSGVFHTLQAQASRLIVSHLLSKNGLGYYTVAMNLATTLSFIPVLYCSSNYPLLSQYYKSNAEKFRWLYRLNFRTMMFIALPIALLMSLTAKDIVLLYAGQSYLPSVPLFTAMIWTLIPQFAGTVLHRTLLAAGQQYFFPRVSAVRLLIRVVLYIILLPRLGTIGAAFAVWAMYGIGFGIYGALKATRTYVIDWFRSMLRPSISLLITATLLVIFRPSWLITWIVGLGVYTSLLFLLQNVDRRDIERIHCWLKAGL
jgi:O-antigen/teichoic acid export membrane protein